jgi:hypothetical protein
VLHTKDMWDFDANWIAVAAGVPEHRQQAERVMHATTQQLGWCGTHMPSWVSAKAYDREHTYSDARGVQHTSDGAIAMARIAWMEAHARRAIGDVAGFERRVLAPLQREVSARVFLSERYSCHGFPAKHRFFPEYPEVVAVLLREVRYGIRVEPFAVQVNPFGVHQFRYQFGELRVCYSREHVRLSVPGARPRRVHLLVGGLLPGARYRVEYAASAPGGCSVAGSQGAVLAAEVLANAEGELRFDGTAGRHCQLEVTLCEE